MKNTRKVWELFLQKDREWVSEWARELRLKLLPFVHSLYRNHALMFQFISASLNKTKHNWKKTLKQLRAHSMYIDGDRSKVSNNLMHINEGKTKMRFQDLYLLTHTKAQRNSVEVLTIPKSSESEQTNRKKIAIKFCAFRFLDLYVMALLTCYSHFLYTRAIKLKQNWNCFFFLLNRNSSFS